MFINSEGLRTSIDSQVTIDGVTHNNLRDPILRERLGIQEIPDPVRMDERHYFVNEIDQAPYILNIPKDTDTIRKLKSLDIANYRFIKEVSGTTLPDGTNISTDRHTQSTITAAMVRLQRKPAELIDWKGVDGWVKLDKEATEAIADVIGDHVQACFSAERAKLEELAALTDFDSLVSFDPTL